MICAHIRAMILAARHHLEVSPEDQSRQAPRERPLKPLIFGFAGIVFATAFAGHAGFLFALTLALIPGSIHFLVRSARKSRRELLKAFAILAFPPLIALVLCEPRYRGDQSVTDDFTNSRPSHTPQLGWAGEELLRRGLGLQTARALLVSGLQQHQDGGERGRKLAQVLKLHLLAGGAPEERARLCQSMDRPTREALSGHGPITMECLLPDRKSSQPAAAH
ncbi:MAG: hypothetical protein GMKNLPBB_02131 [Myxococcota bacterium]|nr:hypothetical protein [Myxococcota bacterium]